ncbi:hypothetical protein [Pelotalea chapellei]|uniref:Uncharacterized protein n=1 Tax=Pelotalea chapellei TaxID=44671 RepID=A0ABS5UD40_9BACT|nr:hypothetical protein [Pelotalea chapellei]MBT1073582.1 hypothetical protein [Pelotalea chapellei]
MLVELKGSPKQIAWAKNIRTDRLSRWRQSDPLAFRKVETALDAESSAAWWITHREKGLVEVLPFIAGGAEKRATAKPKVTKVPSTPVVSSPKESFSGLGDLHKYVGELRSVATGEVVVDPECPF